MAGVTPEDLQSHYEVWADVLDGISVKQIEAGYEAIALGGTEFNIFPPSPQSFRQLCECFYSYDRPTMLDYVYSKTEKTQALKRQALREISKSLSEGAKSLNMAILKTEEWLTTIE